LSVLVLADVLVREVHALRIEERLHV
jgi:hypothetical protein